jgi:mutator protein MutT
MAEFPGGKCEPGETPAECALRECREETGLDVEAVATLDDILWTYPHGTVHLHFLRCRPAAPFDGSVWRPPFRWVDADELAALDFPAANQAVLRWLAANLSALA